MPQAALICAVVMAPGRSSTGTPRVQSTMVDTGRMLWSDVARVLSAKPAQIGLINEGERAQGRPIAVGEPANITLVDPAARGIVNPAEQGTASQNSPFRGTELPGRVIATFLRGRPTVLDGQAVAPVGASAWDALDEHSSTAGER